MTEYDPTEPVPGLQTAITGVVMPPISASYRDALLEVKGQVERTAAMHETVGHAIEAIARAHRNMGLAVNGLLAAIGALIKAQEAEMNRPEPEVELPSTHPVRDLLLADQQSGRHPRGHPCRDCGRYFDEHRPAQEGDGDMHCEGWR